MNKLLILVLFLPLKHIDITSGYGYRIHPVTGKYAFHSGIDLRAHHDTVFAICSGLSAVSYDQLLGLNVRICDTSGLCCTYSHLSQVFGSGPVSAGTPIGITGATGCVTGEHLHFAVAINGRYSNPLPCLFYTMQHINNK